MASYNGERFVGEQLQSFIDQSRQPDELVICDDGSTDSTVAIAEEFARTAPFPVHVHRNPQNLGYARNFERAIGLCSGDIIFLSDQDDVWFRTKLATVTGVFAAHSDVLVVANDQILTDGELAHTGITKLQNLEAVGRDGNSLIEGCCTAIRRDWAERLFPFPPGADPLIQSVNLSHDNWINELSILLNVRRLIREPLQFFRRTGENTTSWVLSEPRRPRLRDIVRGRSGTAPTESWARRIAVLDLYERFLTTTDPLPGDRDAALRRLTHERTSLEQRINLAGLPRLRRLPSVLRLWRRGGYRYFERGLSVVNDLIRV
jgi:glycosyltransferase involved in cell wall biosynthesis